MAWRGLAALAACLALGGGRSLSPPVCERFAVQRAHIIRTEESRAMGARYLQELDVGSRPECQRLCCETDDCDVFVLEEQSPGSCYLFACGPPEDFRCKFTAHGNFSSGVLALSRRLAELQDEERRVSAGAALPAPAAIPAGAARPAPAVTESTSTSTTTTASTSTSTARPTTAAPRRCSRYQFECHSGGECIAVYNACDGVAQCADGSDEAPELGCPAGPVPPPETGSPRWPAPPPESGSPHWPAPPPESGSPHWPARLALAEPRAQPQATHRLGEVPRAHRPPLPPPPPYGEEVAEGLIPGGGQAELPWAGWRWAGWPPPANAPPPHDSPKKGPPPPPPPPLTPIPILTAPPPPPTTPPAPTLAPTPPTHAPKASVRTVHERLLSESADVEEGPAERPRAAALLLVLGLGMSVAAAALALGCGARRGRRQRGMRAPSRADYLVNGMYL